MIGREYSTVSPLLRPNRKPIAREVRAQFNWTVVREKEHTTWTSPLSVDILTNSPGRLELFGAEITK